MEIKFILLNFCVFFKKKKTPFRYKEKKKTDSVIITFGKSYINS